MATSKNNERTTVPANSTRFGVWYRQKIYEEITLLIKEHEMIRLLVKRK